MHVVICGAGVIGSAIAYELTRRGAEVTLVERWRVGGAASGKSGGFLARDWCDGTPVEALAHRSFDLHARWADELGNTYGYRSVDTYGAAMSTRRALGARGDTDLAPWLAPEAAHRSRLGTRATTAQLDPEAFTKALADAACRNGAKLLTATVSDLEHGADGAVRGVMLEHGETLQADAVVIAMGPWSVLAARWLPLPPVYGLKGHSVVFKPERPLPPEAIFAEFEADDGEIHAPEIVPRADGSLYICGLSGSADLPLDPAHVAPEDGGCERLTDIAMHLVPALANAEVLTRQACYRPIAADGLPLIGAIRGHPGAYAATGHSVWGMLNAPGTGEAVAELITTGTTTHVDLTPFAPERLEPLAPDARAVQSS